MDSARTPHTSLRKLSTILIFLLGLIRTNSQDIQSYQICPSGAVTIPSDTTNFDVTHSPSGDGQSAAQCTLILRGLRPGGYVALSGATKGTSTPTCTLLHVGDDGYCAGENGNEPAILINGNGEMNITVSSATVKFELKLVTNYSPCPRQSILLGESKSGIISSNSPTHTEIDPVAANCTVVLSEVPRGATLGVYPLLNHILKEAQDRKDFMYISEGGSNIANLYDKNAPLIVPSSGNGVLNFNYQPVDDDEITRLQFIIQITVLTCSQPPPIVDNSAPATATTPYLAGLAVMEYQCKDEYQFKSSEFTSTICEAKIMGDIIMTGWNDTTDVLCIPEPRCFTDPKPVANTDQTEIDDKTYVYQCSEGYTGDTANVTVKCASSDEDKIPWSWDISAVNTTLNCKPVSCAVPAGFRTVDNGVVEFNRSFVFGNVLTVICDQHHRQDYEIKCNSSGYWSAVPECLRSAECILEPSLVIENGEITHTDESRYYNEDSIIYTCNDGYSQSGERICQTDTTWSGEIQCQKDVPVVIIGVCVGVAILLVVIVVIAVICCKKCRNQNPYSGGKHIREPDEGKCLGSPNSESNYSEPLYHELQPRPDVVPYSDDTNHYMEPGTLLDTSLYQTTLLTTNQQANLNNGTAKPAIPKTKPNLSFKHKMPTDTVYRGNSAIRRGADRPPPIPTTAPAPPKPPRQHQTNSSQDNDVTLVQNDLYEGVRDNNRNSNNNTMSIDLQDNELYEGSGTNPSQTGGENSTYDGNLYES